MESDTVLVLDTTYVLPLFGVEIDLKDGFKAEIEMVWTRGIKDTRIILPSTCLLEVLYKLNREFRQSQDIGILRRYSLVLPTITKHPFIKIWNPLLDSITSNYSFNLRKLGHSDLLDCLIFATAWRYDATLVTEDKELIEINKKLSNDNQIQIISWKSLNLEL